MTGPAPRDEAADVEPSAVLRMARRPLHPDITEEMIETLVRTFYGHVRADPVLAPVFEAAIDDWEPHLRTMMDFWSSVTLMTGRFKGQPVQKHQVLGIGPGHFRRWLRLFAVTAREVAPPEIAAIFIERSEMIAASLQRGVLLAGRPDGGAGR